MTTSTDPTQPESKKSKRSIVGSELNLEKNSIFTVSTYRRRSREIVAREISPTGDVYERKAIIGRTVDGIETGILTVYHFMIYLALIKLWEEAGRPTQDPVHFTVLKIIKHLGMADSGREYNRIKKWLRHLRQIPLTFINSFYIPGVAKHTDLTDITILSRLHIYERKRVGQRQRIRGYGEFRFDDYILESLASNYTHPLRLDVIKSFKKHKDLAILLYTYIDRNLAFKNKYEIGLEKLFNHLDLSQSYIQYPSQRKKKMVPVLEQLESRPLSTGILSYCHIHKTEDGKDYKLVCRKKPFTRRPREQQPLPQPQLMLPTKSETRNPESAGSDQELSALLIREGLTDKQVTNLLTEKSPELIRSQLHYLLFRLEEYKTQGKQVNKAAIFYSSIKEDWSAPKGYLKAREEKEREAKRIEEERAVRLEREEEARREQERLGIEAYKESLDPEEQTKLRERALQEIRAIEGIREGFISDILIAVKENEILRSEMEKSES